jgi:hypothetical protein
MRTPHRVKQLGRCLGYDNYEVMQVYCGIGFDTVDEYKERGIM